MAEELQVAPSMIRRLILGREPSLYEIGVPIRAILSMRFQSMSRQLCCREKTSSISPSPSDGADGKRVTPEGFSDSDLLELFDAEGIYRQYGIISPSLEADIFNVKKSMFEEKRKRKIAADAIHQLVGDDDIFEDRVSSEIDPWALNREEFSGLLHLLDERDHTLYIFSAEDKNEVHPKSSNEMRITDLIFKHYGRPKVQVKSDFKHRIERKVDCILRHQTSSVSQSSAVKTQKSKWNDLKAKISIQRRRSMARNEKGSFI